ncbi:hypothetical protein [Micromonospora sp. 050-3]|uniref:hypothetical protein n=1 Tax=Micromonospora sp. 050-3 TaxID=2789265 RepID=UPI003979EF43
MAEDVAVALADASRILTALPAGAPSVLLHAEGPATWPVLAEAVTPGPGHPDRA